MNLEKDKKLAGAVRAIWGMSNGGKEVLSVRVLSLLALGMEGKLCGRDQDLCRRLLSKELIRRGVNPENKQQILALGVVLVEQRKRRYHHR